MKNKIKAKLAFLLIGLVWLPLIVLSLPLLVYGLIADWLNKPKRPEEGICYGLLYAQDELVSAMLGFYHQTTVSAMIGHLSKRSATGETMRYMLDLVWRVFTGEKNHSRAAMQDEDRYYFSAKRALLMSVATVSWIWVLVDHLINL